MTSKAQATKKKNTDKQIIFKIKSFCATKGTIKEMKKPTELKKVIANHVSDKTLVPRLYKEVLQLKNKKTTQLKNGQTI